MAAVGAAGGGADYAVTGIVASDAAGDGTLNAALGVGAGHRGKQERGHGECDKGFHDAVPPENKMKDLLGTA
jgi:hypothetical protein